MATNSSALIVPAHGNATNTAGQLVFQEAPKPPIAIANYWLWTALIGGVLVFAALAIWLWQRSRQKALNAPPPPPIPPHDRARRSLERALALISEPKPFTTLVSDTLRVYLEERFDFHAPDRTTEEFLYELQETNLLSRDQKQRLAEFLSSCDLVKFAKYEPTEVELRALYDSALRLVNETEAPPIPANIGSHAPVSSGAQ